MNEVNRIYNEDYVSFEIAKLLKEKGFECEKKSISAIYNELGVFHSLSTANDEYYDYEDFDKYDYIAPTHQMTMRWLRDVHNIFIQISAVFQDQPFGLHYIPSIQDYHAYARHDNFSEYVTYEEACEAAIKYCLENLI